MLRRGFLQLRRFSHNVSIENRALEKPPESNVAAPKPLPDIEVKRDPVRTDIEDILNKKQKIAVSAGESTSGLFGLQTRDLNAYLASTINHCDGLLVQLKESEGEESIQILDDIHGALAQLGNLSGFLSQSTSERREEGRDILRGVERYIEKLNTNPVLMESLTKIVDCPETWSQLDAETRRALMVMMQECRDVGLDKPAKQRAAIQKLHTQIEKEGVVFMKESIRPAKVPIADCSEALLNLPLKNGNIVLDGWHSSDPLDGKREQSWIQYHKYNKHREDTLHMMLGKRAELARATGYDNHVHRVVQGSMAGSVAGVRDFLEATHEQVRAPAREEFYELEKWKFHGSDFFINPGLNRVNELVIFPWDTDFLADEYRKLYIRQEKRFFIPSYADFLSVGSIIEQIGVWLEDTYGATLIPERPAEGELWSPDVIKLAVEHEKEGLIGFLYLDFYSSNQKRAPPCHHVIRGGSSNNLPISVIECNYTPSNGYRPPHLSFKTLEKLFSEIGAALHSMLCVSSYQVTGTAALSPDTRLISTYLHQNISRNPAFLYHLLKHHTRQRVMPRIRPEGISVISNALHLFRTHEVEHHVSQGMLDHKLHTEWSPSGWSSTEWYGRTLEKYSHLPYVENTAPHLRFTPLFTQGGKVYSHLWCKAIANILYDELFVLDPFSRHGGEYFREHFLRHGAARNPREMVEYLTGSKLSAERLAAALVNRQETSVNFGQGFLVEKQSTGPQWWHRLISSPDSALLSRLSTTHPHMINEAGLPKLTPKFDKTKVHDRLSNISDYKKIEG